jgi:hypothetical protein
VEQIVHGMIVRYLLSQPSPADNAGWSTSPANPANSAGRSSDAGRSTSPEVNP